MSSSYTKGTRIAIDINKADQLNSEYIRNLIKEIRHACGQDVSLSTHSIITESESWDSVLQFDKFFKDVLVINDIETFINEIKRDRTLKGVDVAKYILSKLPCTHLKLEKLVYLCFADYLCETQKRLFDDKIYAFKYGPVIDSVYEKYKSYGGEPIETLNKGDLSTIKEELECSDKNSKQIEIKSTLEYPQRSRILFAEDGISKLKCIESVIKKYGSFTANQLVSITHRSGSPWTKSYTGNMYSEISEKCILKYHYNET